MGQVGGSHVAERFACSPPVRAHFTLLVHLVSGCQGPVIWFYEVDTSVDLRPEQALDARQNLARPAQARVAGVSRWRAGASMCTVFSMNEPLDPGVVLAELAEIRQEIQKLREGASVADGAEGSFWALDGLRRRRSEGGGSVMLVGSVVLDQDSPYDWQQVAAVADLVARDWSSAAPEIAALGHPMRLAILQSVTQGQRTTGELMELPGMGTVGQLHHHLRQLVSAGWLHHTSRGHYQVPAIKIVPLLGILASAQR